jgi:hypothetical protein
VSLALKLGDGEKFEDAILEVAPEKFKSYRDFSQLFFQFQ